MKKSNVFYTILLLTIVIIFSSNEFIFAQDEKSGPLTKILYTVKAGEQRYLIHFDICAGNETLKFPQILVTSDLETKQIASPKVIYSNTCREFEATINAKYVDVIKIFVK